MFCKTGVFPRYFRSRLRVIYLLLLSGMNPVKKLTAVICCSVFLGLYPQIAGAGIHPENNSKLNTVHVMFEFDQVYAADNYRLEIVNTLTRKTIEVNSLHLAVLVNSGLEFGQRYRWRVRAYKKKQQVHASPWYQFHILTAPQVMPDSFRADVHYTGTPGTGIILADHSAMAIDKTGKPVWFLPVPADSLNKWVIRDLCLTGSGTFTYLDNKGAYEKDPAGVLLWHGPDNGLVSGSTREEYHHELKKFPDGSRMVCGSIYLPGERQSTAFRYNTIIWYNADNTVRWSWNEPDALAHDPAMRRYKKMNSAGHLNGFAWWPGGGRIFASFKNLSDVLVINIRTGRVEASLQQSATDQGFSFRQQHGPFLNRDNELYIYNNNVDERGESETPVFPSVMLFRYDTSGKRFTLLWNHELRPEQFPGGMQGKEGYVSETAAGTALVCAGGVNYLAEIDRKTDRTVWECFFYKRVKNDTAWKPYSNYRCHSISSLYPMYFTLEYAGRKNNGHHFRLYNAGSEAGTFSIQFSHGKNNNKLIVFHSGSLAPGASQQFTIPATAAGISATVTPLHWPAPEKTYLFKRLP